MDVADGVVTLYGPIARVRRRFGKSHGSTVLRASEACVEIEESRDISARTTLRFQTASDLRSLVIVGLDGPEELRKRTVRAVVDAGFRPCTSQSTGLTSAT